MPILEGSSYVTFVVELSQPADETLSIQWTTQAVTAVPGVDYAESVGTVTFLPGETQQTIEVLVYGRPPGDDENRKFRIRLLPAPNLILGNVIGECTIRVIDQDDAVVSTVTVASGADGLSTYELAKLQGYQGSLDDWLLYVRGDQEGLLRQADAPLNGVGDDAPAIQELYDDASRGLSLNLLAPVRMRVASPVLIEGRTFNLCGSGSSYSLGDGTGIEVTVPNAFDVRNSDGFSVRNAHIRATGGALTSGSLFDFKASNDSSSNSGMLLFDQLRIDNVYQAFTLRKVFQAQFRAVRIANCSGAYAIGINGLNDDAQGNIFEFLGGGTGAVKDSPTDHIVFDGGSGSAKFVGWAMNFGRNAIVSKSDTLGSVKAIQSITQAPDGSFRITTVENHGLPNGSVVEIAGVSPAGVINGQQTINYVSPTVFDLDGTEWIADVYTGGTVQNVQGRDPGFIYAVASGAENITGSAFELERGGLLIAGDGYYSTDRGKHIVNQHATYIGRIKFNNNMMRAGGRHGVRLMRGNASFGDCDIVNNGADYVDGKVHAIESITDNGAGLIRVTTVKEHGLGTGDQLRQTRCGSANGTYIVTVIGPKVYDCQGSVFAAGATPGVALRLQQVVTGISNNAGGIRITVPASAFDDGEWVRLSGFGGNANGDFRVSKNGNDPDHHDLVMSTTGAAPFYTGGYAATGLIQRCSAQVYIGPGARNVTINGGLIGTSTQGLNRCRYAIIIEPGCANITIDCDISTDVRSAILNLSASEPTVNIRNRRLSEANLRAIRALTTAPDKMTYWTGLGAAATTDLTAAGRTFLAAVDAAAQRTALGLGAAALTNVANTFIQTNIFSVQQSFTSATFTGTIVRGGTTAITYNAPDGNAISSPGLQTQSSTQAGASVSGVLTSTSAASAPTYVLAKRRDTANAALTNGNRLGDYGWSGSDGTNIIGAAAIRCEATADFTTNAANTRLLFMVASAGAPVNVLTLAPASLSPANDNAMSLGLSGTRFSVVYAATGAINTSDEREKQDIESLADDDALLDAWGSIAWSRFRFRDAVLRKGDGARSHFGLIAQQVRDTIDAALGEGEAIRLGLVCHDVWPAQAELRAPIFAEREIEVDTGEVDEDDEPIMRVESESYDTGETELVRPASPAGDRWGLRYDECFAVEAAWQRREIQRMAERLAALEA